MFCPAATLLASRLPLAACSKNPFESDMVKVPADKSDSGFVQAKGLVQGSAQAASDLHQDAASNDRVGERMAVGDEQEVKPEVSMKSVGTPMGEPSLSKGRQAKSLAAGTILKRAALA